MPGQPLSRRRVRELLCTGMCQTLLHTKEIPWLCSGKTGCAGSLLLAPLSLCLSCGAKCVTCKETAQQRGAPGACVGAMVTLLSLCLVEPLREMLGLLCCWGGWGLHTKWLPDLSFPDPGLKGALVPFAGGEAGGQAGFVYVQLSQLLAAQGAELLPEILWDSASLLCLSTGQYRSL